MRHLGRSHRVSVDWLHEQFASDQITLVYEKTDRQAGDIFKKGFTNPDKWRHAAKLINVLSPSLLKAIGRAGTKPRSSFEVPPQVAVPRDSPEQLGSCVPYAAARLVENALSSSDPVLVSRTSRAADLVGRTSRAADRGPFPASSRTAGGDSAYNGQRSKEEDIPILVFSTPTQSYICRLVELCCSDNSILGQDGPNTSGCERIQVT
jgi:hypothetical protein